MNKLYKLAVWFLALALSTPVQASVANVYVTLSGAGSQNGADCADGKPYTFVQTSSNWGAGSSQIGPGTTVHLCGTITTAAGSSGLLTYTDGTSGSPIVIYFEPNAVLQAAYFGNICQFQWSGSGPSGGIDGGCFGDAPCTVNCNAGIEIENNYIVVDGGTNGILQSTHNGTNYTPLATVGSGPSFGGSQQPNEGVFIGVKTGIKVRNLTVQHIYDNAGTGATADCSPENDIGPTCDSGGVATWDIRIAGGATSVSVCNNYVYDARIGIVIGTTPVADNAVDGNCQSNTFVNGMNIFLNTTDKHAWQMATSVGGAADATENVYANKFGSQTNYFGPMSTYHEDGFIMEGGDGANLYVFLFNNWFSGDLTGANTTAEIFVSDIGTGSDAIVAGFNNLVTSTTTVGLNPPCCAVIFGNGDVASTHPSQWYNNTFDNYDVDWWTYGAPNVPFLMKNNLHKLGNLNGETGTVWYFIPDGAANYAQFAGTDRNLYFLTPGGSNFGQAWNITGAEFQTLSSWQSASGLDANSLNADPLLDGTWHITSGASPAVGLGFNLTSLCTGGAPALAYLCYDKPANVGVGGAVQGNLRPTSGNWDAGVYQFSTTPPPPPAPPTHLALTGVSQ